MTYEEGKGIIEALDGSKLSAKLFLLAIKSLDKQVPKVPDIYGDGYADGEMVYDMWKCPNCGQSYELDHDIYDYCPCCGQSINWSVLKLARARTGKGTDDCYIEIAGYAACGGELRKE